MPEAASEPRRRFLRFGLRAVFAIVLLVAVLLAWTKHKAHEQADAVSRLTKAGCTVAFATDKSLGYLEMLRELLGEERPRNVIELDETQVTDAGLAHLTALKQLKMLDLRKTKVTDAGLAQLKGIATLTKLDLRETEVSVGALRGFHKAMPYCSVDR
jgi:hypothetical protein